MTTQSSYIEHPQKYFYLKIITKDNATEEVRSTQVIKRQFTLISEALVDIYEIDNRMLERWKNKNVGYNIYLSKRGEYSKAHRGEDVREINDFNILFDFSNLDNFIVAIRRGERIKYGNN